MQNKPKSSKDKYKHCEKVTNTTPVKFPSAP